MTTGQRRTDWWQVALVVTTILAVLVLGGAEPRLSDQVRRGSLSGAVADQTGAVIAGAQVRLAKVEEYLEGLGLKRIGLLQFQLTRLVLLLGGKHDAQCEVQLHIVAALDRKRVDHLQRFGSFSKFKVCAY